MAKPVSAVTLPLPANAAQETGGNLDRMVAIEQQNVYPLLLELLTELRVTNQLLHIGLNVRDDLGSLREEICL